jgi:hypothetical protein
MVDMILSGSACYIECGTSRYTIQNYTFIFETWLTKSQLQDLRASIRPGATGELFKVLGRPRNYDKSWSGANTIQFIPIAGSKMSERRGKRIGFVKSIRDSTIEGDKGHLFVKIECLVSGQGDL